MWTNDAVVQVTNYPGEEILLVYDPDYTYGENFYVCLTEEGKAEYLDSLKKEEEAEEGMFVRVFLF